MSSDVDRTPEGMPPLPPLPPTPIRPAKLNDAEPDKSTQVRRRKLRKRLIWIGVPVLLVAGLVSVMETIAITTKPLHQDLDDALDDLSATIQNADLLLAQAGDLEVDMQSTLEAALDEAEAVHSAARNPFVYTLPSMLEERLENVDDAEITLTDALNPLRYAIGHRDSYEDTVTHAEGLVDEATDLIDESQGAVTDESLRTSLSTIVGEVEALLDFEVDGTSGDAFATQSEDIQIAINDDLNPALEAVEASVQDYEEQEQAKKEAEEQAALKDPQNYSTISDRDWKLVQRDADNYTGKKYIIYGYVTQADGATGNSFIRVDTSGEAFDKWYDYDINTLVFAADPDLLNNVVQGDLVQMLVEVQGTSTYDTAIGGSATAVMVMAYDIKVTGF